MRRGIFWYAGAWDGYLDMQDQKSLLKKVNTLIKDIQRNGYLCSYGKPERLASNLSGLASVRIDKKNRLVFSVECDRVNIIECGSHYGDHKNFSPRCKLPGGFFVSRFRIRAGFLWLTAFCFGG